MPRLYRMDHPTYVHLTSWCDSNLRAGEDAATTRDAVVAFLEAMAPDDAAYQLDLGWTRLVRNVEETR